MRMQVNFRVLVADGDSVQIGYFCNGGVQFGFRLNSICFTMTVHEHLVSCKCLLEGGAHKRVARTGVSEDGEMYIEEGEVYDEGNDYKANNACRKVSPEMFLS
jgi:hypothetical protein